MDLGLRCPSLKGAMRDSPLGSSAQIRAWAMSATLATSCCPRVKRALGRGEQSTSKKAMQNPTSSELINPRVAI
jgi:hypothetical protein